MNRLEVGEERPLYLKSFIQHSEATSMCSLNAGMVLAVVREEVGEEDEVTGLERGIRKCGFSEFPEKDFGRAVSKSISPREGSPEHVTRQRKEC